MRELTLQEKAGVSGGILAAIGFGLALGGKATAGGGVAGWAISSAGLIAASYSLAAAYGPVGGGGRIVDTGSMCMYVP